MTDQQDPWANVKRFHVQPRTDDPRLVRHYDAYPGQPAGFYMWAQAVDAARQQVEAQHAETAKALKFACHDAVLRVADRALECDQLRSERDIAHSNHMNALALSGDWKQRADAAESELTTLRAQLTEREQEIAATKVIDAAFRCWRCGASAVQPNDRCDSHMSWQDRLQTEIEHHNAWRKRADEAEAEITRLKGERA